MEIEEHVAVSFPCCEVVDVNTRHARTYPSVSAGTQVAALASIAVRFIVLNSFEQSVRISHF